MAVYPAWRFPWVMYESETEPMPSCGLTFNYYRITGWDEVPWAASPLGSRIFALAMNSWGATTVRSTTDRVLLRAVLERDRLFAAAASVEPDSASWYKQAAPFSGRPCVYWEVDVATRAKNSWHVVHREASGSPFYLRDETGLALVHPAEATVRIGFQLEEQCAGVSLPEVYARYLHDRRPVAGALWRVGSLRFRERVLEAGQQVYVLGTAMPRPQSVAISTDEDLEMTGTDGWRARRLQHLDPEVRAVVRRGENERTYIISQQSERDLTMQLGLEAAAGLVVGPALALLGLGYWLLALGGGRWPR